MTTETETFCAYLDRVPRDSPLTDLCREIAQDEPMPMTDSIHLGLNEGLVGVVGPLLYSWAYIELQALRNRKETQEAARRIEMIKTLELDGDSPERAERLVDKALSAIGKRNREDPSIKALLQIVEVTKGELPPSHVDWLAPNDPAQDESASIDD